MPEGDFPGDTAVDAYAEKCGPVLDGYTNIDSSDESVQLAALYPTAETHARGPSSADASSAMREFATSPNPSVDDLLRRPSSSHPPRGVWWDDAVTARRRPAANGPREGTA